MPKLNAIERSFLNGRDDWHHTGNHDSGSTFEELDAFEAGRNHAAYETQLELAGILPSASQLSLGF